jgi:hypothetical protein
MNDRAPGSQPITDLLREASALGYLRRMRWAPGALALSLSLVLASMGTGGIAVAQPSDADLQRARELFAQAEKAEAGENWQVALDALRQVAAIKTTAVVLYHTGICEERLGRVADALAHFEQSEAMAREQGAAQVQQLAADRVAKTSPRVPRVKLVVSPKVARTELTLDGKPVTLDKSGDLRLNPNKASKLRVTAPGRKPIERQLFLNEGVTEEVRLTLEVAAAGAPAAAAPVGAGPEPTPEPDTAPSRKGPPLGTWIAGGAAVALAAGGFVTFAVAGGEASAGEEKCPAPPNQSAECDQDVRDTVQLLDRMALGLWIGSAAALGVGATLWVLDANSAPTSGGASSSPSLSLGLRPAGAELRGRF